MAEAFRCADVSRALDEPLHGTASRVRNWLLVEQPGPWGYDAVAESRLPVDVAAGLKLATGRHHIRLLLIQRPGGAREPGPLHCFAVHSASDHQWVQHLPVNDPTELLDVDFGTMRRGEPPGRGRRWRQPLYLVCTNGGHDPCCERYGEPVAHGLNAARRSETWRCSHVGGDRFAANLVCLPHGFYFGRVGPEDAEEIASLYENGLIHLDHFRGRSCYESVVQAADVIIRRQHMLPGIDDLVPVSRRDHEGGRSLLVFRDRSGRRHEISIVVRRAQRRPITCTTSSPGAPREYRVVAGPSASGDA